MEEVTPVQAPMQGLHRDSSPITQPENSYRYALNAVVENKDGDVGFLTNEQSNALHSSLPSGYQVIGSIYLNELEQVIFATNESISYIGILSPRGLEEVISEECLGFSALHPIRGIFRLKNGNEKIIYFCDGFNPDRAINIDRLSEHQVNDVFQCVSTRLNLSGNIPLIDNVEVVEFSGSLEVGTYTFYMRYTSQDDSATNFIQNTKAIPITDEGEGAFDINTSRSGAIRATNQSIRIDLSNVDTRFTHIQFAVSRLISGDGETTETYILPKTPINSSTLSYTYSGVNVDSDILTNLEEILISTEFYESSLDMQQIDNRLIRSNLSNINSDWVKFQQAANKIKVEFRTKRVEDTTSASYYQFDASFRRDEVYALGIVWEFIDGTESPVLHIPGREKDDERINLSAYNSMDHYRSDAVTNVDSDLVTVVATNATPTANQVNLEDVKHLGLEVGDTAERWQVFNNAYTFTNANVLAYYETDTAYPDTVDNNGIRMYPSGNIRHHRMPDNIIEPAYFGSRQSLGLLLTDINPPSEFADRVQGYRIVRGLRTDNNKTILDQGLLENTVAIDGFGTEAGKTVIIPSAPYNLDRLNDTDSTVSTSPTVKTFHSPLNKFFKTAVNANFLKVEAKLRGKPNYTRHEITNVSVPEFGEFRSYVELFNSGVLPEHQKSLVRDSLTLGYNKFATLDDVFSIKGQGSQRAAYLSLGSENIAPTDTDTSLLDDSTSQTYYYLVNLKANREVYNNLDAITYVSCGYGSSNEVLVYGGDTFIGRFDFRKTGSQPLYAVQDDGTERGYTRNTEVSHITCFLEVDFNIDLRTEGEAKAFDPRLTSSLEENLVDSQRYFPRTYSDDIDTYLSLYHSFENYAVANTDYDMLSSDKLYFPLDIDYDPNSTSDSSFPFRVIYSEKAFQEDKTDSYRIFRTENYSDIKGSTGEIINLFVRNNRLYALTTESLFRIFSSEQTIKTNESSIFLGTGDFFAIPAREIVESGYNYAGCQSRFGHISTEYGHFFVDATDGKVFLFNESLKDISQDGLRNFLKENLPLNIVSQYERVTKNKFPLRADLPTCRLGITVGFDSRHSRLLITKHDFVVLDEQNLSSGELIIDSSGKWYYQDNLVNPNNSPLFEDVSWTVSYSMLSNKWVSFHSYKPSMYITSKNRFYSINQDEKIYQHNKEGYQNFYNIDYPHEIEVIMKSNPTQTTIFNSFRYQAITEGDSFDKVALYNDYQSSGELTFVDNNHNYVLEKIDYIELNRIERDFFFNGFVNRKDINTPIFNSSSLDINQTFSTFPFKNWWEEDRFRDKYLAVRLTLNATTDKHVTNFLSMTYNYSLR